MRKYIAAFICAGIIAFGTGWFVEGQTIGPPASGGAGLSNFSSDGTTLSGSGQTVTSNAPILNLTQTWNGAGQVFRGAVVNVTDTASSAASGVLEAQYGGSTFFRVGKGASGYAMLWLGPGITPSSGNAVLQTQGAGAPLFISSIGSGDPIVLSDPANLNMSINSTVAKVASGMYIGWANGTTAVDPRDTAFSRNAAGVVEVNNGTAGQYASLKLATLVNGGSAPGISGCSAGTQTGGATVGTYSSGTTGTCTVTLTFAFTAPTGWFCRANDLTTPADVQSQTATSTTTATIAGTTVSGDVINFGCTAY